MIKPKELSIQVHPYLNLAGYLQGLELVSVDLSQSGHLFVLAAKHPLDYRRVINNASFAMAHPDNPNDFVVFEFSNGRLLNRTEILEQSWNYHSVQPLPNNELLLVCGRIRGETNNARVFSSEGVLKRDFTLGDGIEHVQTTADGQIWVGYFDEGVFGNTPLSQSGINCFDKFGKLVYSHDDQSMVDCYALNVVSNTEVWSCYYTDFPLVQIKNYQVTNSWISPVRGSHTFTVWRNWAFFSGGYREHHKYLLLNVTPHQEINVLANIQLLDSDGEKPEATWTLARGSKMFFINEIKQCFEIDLKDVVNAYLN